MSTAASRTRPQGFKIIRTAATAVTLGVACLLTWNVAQLVNGVVLGANQAGTALGAMWAVLSTIAAFSAIDHAEQAGRDRLAATVLSAVICLIYLAVLPSSGVGLAAVVALGAFVLLTLQRPTLIPTASITTAVVFVVAGLGPRTQAWTQPLMRLLDTGYGVIIGVALAIAFRTAVHRLAGRTRD